MGKKSELKSAAAEQYLRDKQKQEENDQRLHGEVQRVSLFRQALPQVLASTAKNLILLDLGMTIAFPTFVIPALLNAKEGLSFDSSQASWFGSISFICQPLGSILSGIVLEPLGRKYSMLIVNIPHIIGWLLLYAANSLFMLYSSAVIMGLGVGFMEAPIITYVGEISEPRLRGILTSYSGLFVSLGFVATYILGSLAHWQQAALVSTLVPIITIIAISQVPETPLWLLSRGRLDDAEKALCWLRGWVEPRAVRQELAEMIRYSEASKLKKSQPIRTVEKVGYVNEIKLDDENKVSNSANGNAVNYTTENLNKLNQENGDTIDKEKTDCDNRFKENDFVTVDLNYSDQSHPDMKSNRTNKNEMKIERVTVVEHEDDWRVLLKDLVRPEMLKPLGVVISFFFFLCFSGIAAMRPYFVIIFKELNIPINPYRATGVLFAIAFIATILCMVCVRVLGKRLLGLSSLLGCALAMITLGVYTHINADNTSSSYIPFLMFMVLQFFTGFGVAPVPWMLVSEVFPFRGRSLASGVAAATSYVFNFIASKTTLSIKDTLSLSGMFFVYGSSSIIGFVVLYLYMPETEGRSLEEIEESYKTRKSKPKD